MTSPLVRIRSREENSGSRRRNLYIHTFGCQMNEYDSAKLARLLERDYVQVANPREADLVIVNTCSVREKPEQKLFSMLGELGELKNERPELLVGVGGCVAQQEGDAIVKRSRTVDFVFGTHNLSLVPALIQRRQEGQPPQVAVNYRDEWEDLPLGFAGESRVSVFVSVSRGCNKNCTYCIVPTTRGREVSRSLDEILREVRISAHRGAREVVLLGQTVNSYGRDLTPRVSFATLVHEVAAVPGVERIRFTSPHPQDVRPDFIDLMIANPKVCRHIHLPLQSGSDRILKAMNRNYRRQRYLDIVSELRGAISDLAITTDVIVGFPGEQEEDFEATMEVLEQVRFDSSYSFMFSPRPGTPAAEFSHAVPEEVKLARLKRFQTRQDEISTELLHASVGREVEILIEGPSRLHKHQLQGRTSQNVTLNLLDEDQSGLAPGMVVPCTVEGVARYTLRGRTRRLRAAAASVG